MLDLLQLVMELLNCGALNSITIPKTIIYVGNCAFGKGKSLKAVYIISDLEAWCKIKFGLGNMQIPLYLAHRLYLNGEIQELEIPNSITEIKDFAFQGMSSMTSVIIPNSVKSIGKEAFFFFFAKGHHQLQFLKVLQKLAHKLFINVVS